MQQEIYKGDVLQKIAGISFIVGAILLPVFGFLHPGNDLGEISEVIRTIADSNGGFWEIEHIFVTVLFWALMIGIVGVYSSISSEGAAPWVRLGFYGLIVGTIIRTVFLALDGVGLAAVAALWERAAGADKVTIFVAFSSLWSLLDGLRSLTDIIYGLGLVFLGVGISLSTFYSKRFGWTIIILGGAWAIVGLVIGIAGMSAALEIPFGIVFILTIVWHLVLGIVIIRKEIQAM